MRGSIALLVSDLAVLSSLGFALSIEGFEPVAASVPAAVMVIDQTYCGDGMATLLALRASGNGTPAIVLATHPTAAFRARATSAGALLVEKPLLGDELTVAISNLLASRNAA